MTHLPSDTACEGSHVPRRNLLLQFLRELTDCVERGYLVDSDVAQALFREDTYTVACPIAEAENERPPNYSLEGIAHDAAIESLARAWLAAYQAYGGRFVDDAASRLGGLRLVTDE